MSHRKGGSSVDPKTIAKLGITFTFLPCIVFLVVFGSLAGETSFIGVALAMISLLALLWGNPVGGDGPKAGG